MRKRNESSKRPPIAIGHVMLQVADVARAADFYLDLGLRAVFQNATMAILELRGGTHLMLFKEKRKVRRGVVRFFDFMVADVERLRAKLRKAGVDVTACESDRVSGHVWFQARDPDGHRLNVYSDHTEGREI